MIGRALALVSVLGLTGCGDVFGCPVDDQLAKSRLLVAFYLTDGECVGYWSTSTEAVGSLDLEGCETIEPAEALTCGYGLHVRCPGPIVDTVGTYTELDIVGSFSWGGARERFNGNAEIALVVPSPDGDRELCRGTYDVNVGVLSVKALDGDER